MLAGAALASAVALVAVWIGYPLVMAVCARSSVWRRRALATTSERTLPTIAVVIATREDATAIRSRVRDCLALSYDPTRLHVVVALDARSSVHQSDLLDLGERVTVVRGDDPGGKAGALNAAVRAAADRDDVLLFTDTHQRFDCDAARRLALALQADGVAIVSGSLALPAGAAGPRLAKLYWRFERWLRRCESCVRSCVGVSGSIYAMRREWWSPLPADLILDDVFVPMRAVLAGRRVTFVAEARAFETREHTAVHEFHRKVRTLTGVVQLCTKLPAVLVPFRNPLWAQFVFHKLLRLLTPYWALVILLWGLANLPLALIGEATLGLGLLATTPSFGGRVRRMLTEAVLLNAAVVIAGYNGVRGRWHVWN